jgi:hypothetical protein
MYASGWKIDLRFCHSHASLSYVIKECCPLEELHRPVAGPSLCQFSQLVSLKGERIGTVVADCFVGARTSWEAVEVDHLA